MKAKLKVEGMHCGACALTIDGALEELDGVKTSATSFARRRTKVDFDTAQISLEEIQETITSCGFSIGEA